jgi:hypothetical protein
MFHHLFKWHLSENDVVFRQRRCTAYLGRLLSRVLHVETEPALPLRLEEDRVDHVDPDHGPVHFQGLALVDLLAKGRQQQSVVGQNARGHSDRSQHEEESWQHEATEQAMIVLARSSHPRIIALVCNSVAVVVDRLEDISRVVQDLADSRQAGTGCQRLSHGIDGGRCEYARR